MDINTKKLVDLINVICGKSPDKPSDCGGITPSSCAATNPPPPAATIPGNTVKKSIQFADGQVGNPVTMGMAIPTTENVAMPKESFSGGPLGDLIGSGEGNYDSYNRGKVGDSGGVVLFISKMTLKEIIRRQELPLNDPDRIFAVGKYQVTPYNGRSQLRDAADYLNILDESIFTEDLQERVFREYFITVKRRKVKEYIIGQTNDPTAAQTALAMEWAAVASPATGKGYYDKDSAGNSASISALEVKEALEQERKNYQMYISQSMNPDDAWRMLSSV